ncbi:MAG TPA: hypothetical protein VFZ21_21055 [Gemmatimonadaceae bacterium]|nr:hypothetical protein [Gemmatimonadaceae bacterium]
MRAWLACTVAFSVGCEVDGTVAPRLEPRAVVHAVLNLTRSEQVVLVERTLRSAAPLGGSIRDPIDDARIVIYGPQEDSVTATREGAVPGVYRVESVTVVDGSPVIAGPNVLRLRPGARYRLRVETPLGVVTGQTTLPPLGPINDSRRTFNVDRDTLRLTGTLQHPAGYLLRHETIVTARERYVTRLDDPLVRPPALAGARDEAWAFEWARESMRPGHAQHFTIIAVDSNYFRYYVAGFDPFGDDTRGNTLTGGVGLFGAVSTLMSTTLDLVADIDTPIEGSWVADRPSLTLPLTLTLYSSPVFPATSSGGTVLISGRGPSAVGRVLEAFGSMTGAAVELDFFDVSLGSLAWSATGLFANGTLDLTDTRTGERVTYRKR